MSGRTGVRCPACILQTNRFTPYNPKPLCLQTLQPLLTIVRRRSTHIHIPKKYGEKVGRTQEKLLEDKYFRRLMRSQEEPPVVIPHRPGSSKTSLEYRTGRFYDIEPVELMGDILAHHFPRDYFWPNPRARPEMETGRAWDDINWAQWRVPALLSSREAKLKRLKTLRQVISEDTDVDRLYFCQIDILKDDAYKYILLLEAFRIYRRQGLWDKFGRLLELMNMDSRIHLSLRRTIQNQLFKELATNGRKAKSPAEVFEALSVSFHRPFTSEALFYLLDHIKKTTTVLRLFYEDHGILPHISVSNKAFEKEMARMEKSRKWPKDGDKPRTDPSYYIQRRKLYRAFTKHFDADRVNAESIRLLLKYAVDRDEVKRILYIAVQAAKRDPTVLGGTQHFFLDRFFNRYPTELEENVNTMENPIPPMAYQNAENLAELFGFVHSLKEHKQQLNRQALIYLTIACSTYGSSTALTLTLSQLLKSRWKPTPQELRKILRALPQCLGADLITQRHRIIGNPRIWIKYRQRVVLMEYLRRFVGNNQFCLAEYVRALGRCGASQEIWTEWGKLQQKGLQMCETGERVKPGTLAAFLSGLALAGDVFLVKKCFQELKASISTSEMRPMLLAGLMACRPTRSNAGQAWKHAYPLASLAKENIRLNRVMERMAQARLDSEWTDDQKAKARIIFAHAGRLIWCVKNGQDLQWAESAIVSLLKMVALSDGRVTGGQVNITVAWPATNACLH